MIKEKQGQLLMKFLNKGDENWIENNKELLKEITDKVLVLKPLNRRNKSMYLYFKTNEDVDIEKLRLIKINKNTNTNTLYTINGLNKAIERDNPGVKNHAEYKLNWDKYKGVILLENKKFNKLKIIRTRLYDEIIFNEKEEGENNG